ncbi:hypothetical protein [Halopelagius longus]|uniref:hypothetical protein n=1 Tax=Halopelagius longus TaxID=1236180 RepID=UPI001587E76A|nr:hypothetical protein [Halopelagius longus]
MIDDGTSRRERTENETTDLRSTTMRRTIGTDATTRCNEFLGKLGAPAVAA